MLIEGKELTLAYDNKTAVKAVNIQIKKGEIITIVGPNGSGKTTLLKGISRLLPLKGGHILLEGRDLKAYKNKQIAKKVAVLPQIRVTPDDFSVETLIRYGRYPHMSWQGKLSKEDEDIITWALEKTRMLHLRDKKLTQLSGGERQSAWIAMALAQKTEIIILDEPTTFLDLSHQLEILELIKTLNETEDVTILMVLHDLNQAIRYSDRVYVMKDGQVIVEGNPCQVIQSDLLHEVFHVDSDFYKDTRNDCHHFIPHKIKEPYVIKHAH